MKITLEVREIETGSNPFNYFNSWEFFKMSLLIALIELTSMEHIFNEKITKLDGRRV